MNITLVYLHVVGKSDPTAMDPTWYLPCAYRFCTSLLAHPAGMPYKLAVVSCGGPITDDTVQRFAGIATEHLCYEGAGWDIGAHQFAASRLDADLLVFLASPCHFKKEGWLVKLAEAVEKNGEGLYGVAGSLENHPHIRTGAFACSPRTMRAYPILIDSREKCFNFECGCDSQGKFCGYPSRCFSDWVMKQGKVALVVDWMAVRGFLDWRTGPAIYRRGKQEAVLIHDRHTDMYDTADASRRAHLEMLADIGHIP